MSEQILGPVPEDFVGAIEVDFDDYRTELDSQRWFDADNLADIQNSMLGRRMADIAETQRGVAESGGEDRGVPHTRYVRAFGGGLGYLPWCAFFVSWSYLQATGRRPPWTNPGYVPSVNAWARANGRLTSTPQRGDMFGISGTHMGLVAARLRDGQILSIEGNWGDAVRQVRRPIAGLWFATP